MDTGRLARLGDIVRVPQVITRRIVAEPPHRGPVLARLGRSVEAVLASSRPENPLIVVTSGARPALVSAAIEQASPDGLRQLGLAPGLDSRRRGRWLRWTAPPGWTLTELGQGGWEAVGLAIPGALLGEVYPPAELSGRHLVVPLDDRKRLTALACWAEVVHPRTALRVRVGSRKDPLAVELSAAVNAGYLLTLRLPDVPPVCAWTTDPTTASLLALASRWLTERRERPDRTTPWEHPLVQRAAELGMGPANGGSLTLLLAGQDSRLEFAGRELAEVLGCRVLTETGTEDA
jgi:hypothetical protein